MRRWITRPSTEPRSNVVRLGDYSQEPFAQAVNTPLLHSAFDLLVGPGREHQHQGGKGKPGEFGGVEHLNPL